MHAALSPTRPISAEEQQAINDLRTILPSIECLEDSYILRWLRAKDQRFDETADALKKHVTFRKAWELDSIASWEAPECLEKYCGYGFLSDKDGRPILMSLLGNMDVEGERGIFLGSLLFVCSRPLRVFLKNATARDFARCRIFFATHHVRPSTYDRPRSRFKGRSTTENALRYVIVGVEGKTDLRTIVIILDSIY
ncbi:hypothetical protein NECAME_11552 [Necator americanus]|uniref:CRAL/TRIO N-terminal domain-containing protein n=1 Tax=Necator americanus TaxID=51031 RepID=W2T6I2_NECAM|nr:hypothetical protein NECAME_11552 [Necator americanus]ETN76602.1 hypothetical protein NECAME_11552 [Necator americanus]